MSSILELRQKIAENRQKLFDIHVESLRGAADHLRKMFQPLAPLPGVSLEITVTAPIGASPVLSYVVVDENVAELEYGGFNLAFTDVCDVGEFELMGSTWEYDEQDRITAAIKHIVEDLGARRVIYTLPAHEDGVLIKPPYRLDGWMEYLETRPADAERSRFVDVYTWEVPQV